MPLGNSSFSRLPTLADTAEALNLAVVLDEREFLGVDIAALTARELAAEASGGLPAVSTYAVQDPYGEQALGAAVATYFGAPGWPCGVTCGAGVNALLHDVAALAAGRVVYVVGDCYPDFPHWAAQWGARLASRHTVPGGETSDHATNAVNAGAAVVLVDRPSLHDDQFLPLVELRALCAGVAPSGAVVVVDESYANYCPPSFSAATIAESTPNLVVLRGLSKAYWLGGLRVAFCVTSPELTERVRAVVTPMQASSLSLRVAEAVLGAGDVTASLRQRVTAAKAEMLATLADAGVTALQRGAAVLPYVVATDDGAAAAARLAACGVTGKSQVYFSTRALAAATKLRLAVPLAPDRLARLRDQLA